MPVLLCSMDKDRNLLKKVYLEKWQTRSCGLFHSLKKTTLVGKRGDENVVYRGGRSFVLL